MNRRDVGRRVRVATQQGVVLVEALVAILIFSVGIIAVMGMQAASIIQVTQAKYRFDAAYLANQIVGRMWGDIGLDPAQVANKLAAYEGSGSTARAAWDATVAATLPQGAGAIAVNGDEVTVTVTWRMPDDTTTRRYVTVARINLN